jgi:hypothetical protein
MDYIDNLPLDKNAKVSDEEKSILDTYFGSHSSSSSSKGLTSSSWGELKFIIFATLLFLAMGTPFFDNCVEYLPYSDSQMSKLSLKALIYAVSLYVIIIFAN